MQTVNWQTLATAKVPSPGHKENLHTHQLYSPTINWVDRNSPGLWSATSPAGRTGCKVGSHHSNMQLNALVLLRSSCYVFGSSVFRMSSNSYQKLFFTNKEISDLYGPSPHHIRRSKPTAGCSCSIEHLCWQLSQDKTYPTLSIKSSVTVLSWSCTKIDEEWWPGCLIFM